MNVEFVVVEFKMNVEVVVVVEFKMNVEVVVEFKMNVEVEVGGNSVVVGKQNVEVGALNAEKVEVVVDKGPLGFMKPGGSGFNGALLNSLLQLA